MRKHESLHWEVRWTHVDQGAQREEFTSEAEARLAALRMALRSDNVNRKYELVVVRTYAEKLAAYDRGAAQDHLAPARCGGVAA